VPYHRGLSAAQPGRDGVAHQRRRILKHAANARVGKPGVVQSNVKSFNRVRDHTSVEPAKIVQFFVRQAGCDHVGFPFSNWIPTHLDFSSRGTRSELPPKRGKPEILKSKNEVPFSFSNSRLKAGKGQQDGGGRL
jgi:hypothetical protein